SWRATAGSTKAPPPRRASGSRPCPRTSSASSSTLCPAGRPLPTTPTTATSTDGAKHQPTEPHADPGLPRPLPGTRPALVADPAQRRSAARALPGQRRLRDPCAAPGLDRARDPDRAVLVVLPGEP